MALFVRFAEVNTYKPTYQFPESDGERDETEGIVKMFFTIF